MGNVYLLERKEMIIISEWKKRPHKYNLKSNEVMVEAIVDGQTRQWTDYFYKFDGDAEYFIKLCKKLGIDYVREEAK
jgi:hypothetical protein